MKILDRYLIKEIFSPLLLALFVFATILLTDVIIRSVELFINNRVSLSLILRFLLTSLPYILQITIPMAVLTGTLIGFGRMAADSEITALKASGISLFRLSLPVYLIALLAWAMCQYITLFGVPKTAEFRRQIAYQILESNLNVGIKPNVFNDSFPNTVIYCEKIAAKSGYMSDVFLYQNDSNSSTKYIFAKKGLLKSDNAEQKVFFLLNKGVMHEVTNDSTPHYSITEFEKKILSISIPEKSDSHVDIGDDELPYKKLRSEMTNYAKEVNRLTRNIKKNNRKLQALRKEAGIKSRDARRANNQSNIIQHPIPKQYRAKFKQLRKEKRRWKTKRTTVQRQLNKFYLVYHKKFAFPFACLIFPLVAIPLGIRTRAGGKSTGFAISLALILGYYIIEIGGEGMGKEGTIPPWLGIWTANIILSGIGLFLCYKVSKEKEFRWASKVTFKMWHILHRFRNHRLLNRGSEKHKTHASPRRQTIFFNRSFPRILDRYISQLFLRFFLLLVLSLVGITVIMEFLASIKYYLEYNAPFSDYLWYIGLRIPFFIILSIHVAVLIATILTINLLARTEELTAIKASGVSLIRAALPLLFLALVISCGVFFMNERVVPRTNAKSVEIFNYKIKKKARPSLFTQNKNWYRGSHNSVYSFASFDQRNDRQEINDLVLFHLDKSFMPQITIRAKKMVWNETLKTWIYRMGEAIEYDANNLPLKVEKFDSKKSLLSENVQEFRQDIQESDKLNFRELKEYINSLEKKGIDATPYKTDLLAKLSMPLICFVIALFGIPFAITFQRSGTLMGIGFSIFIGMVYFVFYRLGISLGHSGELPPFLAAWAANLLFGFLGLFLILKAKT